MAAVLDCLPFQGVYAEIFPICIFQNNTTATKQQLDIQKFIEPEVTISSA